MDCYFTPERINAFIKNIESFLDDMEKFNRDHPESWKSDYDDLRDDLEEVLNTIEDNPIEANKLFQALPISKYDSFHNYVYNNDINCINSIRGNNERTKILRAKRSSNNCPFCGKPLTLIDASSICENCGYTSDSKSSTPNTRSTSNNTKHTYKQLDALTGTRKAPSNISKIIDYIAIWLTDLHFIYDWLKSNGGKRYEQWVKKYSQLTDEYITQSFFNRVIDRVPENKWDYNTFKLFTDELYNMLEYATRYSNENNSNMEGINDDDYIIEIFESFVKTHKRLPGITEEYVYEGERYEIGLFLNSISLYYDVPANHIKAKLERKLQCNLTMPGLMFNYGEVYNKAANPPKKYCYQQEYCWISNRTFHTPFIDISKPDKEAIANLILKFNDYYKEQTYAKSDKGCNSPLYCCSIVCVLNLPYFQKYKRALEFIPVKDRGTASHIRKEFFKFEVEHPEIFEPYKKVGGEGGGDGVDVSIEEVERNVPKRGSSGGSSGGRKSSSDALNELTFEYDGETEPQHNIDGIKFADVIFF